MNMHIYRSVKIRAKNHAIVEQLTALLDQRRNIALGSVIYYDAVLWQFLVRVVFSFRVTPLDYGHYEVM